MVRRNTFETRGSLQPQGSVAALRACALLILMAASGCTGISVAPSCPNELEIGTSGVVSANVIDPGAVPVYQWEAIPADAGTFVDGNMPIARFTAAKAGDVTIQLTASDGLFQVQSFCTITVIDGSTPPPPASGIAVSLSANPAAPTTGQPVTITCRSTGSAPAIAFDLQRVAGLDVSLTALGSSSVVFTPAEAGSVTFQCVGRAADNTEGNPATLTLTIAEPAGGGRPPR